MNTDKGMNRFGAALAVALAGSILIVLASLTYAVTNVQAFA
jgi:hypothetical protein